MKKSSALALAIAGTLAAPMVMAEGVYVSARLGVDYNTSDDDAAESMTFGNLSTRMGWKGETDLGNGLTAFGKFEVTSSFGTRDLYVGLMGDFGKVTIAESAYGAFYNHVTGPVDQPYWIGGGGFLLTGRTKNMISYAGGNDMFSFEVGAMADGTDTTEPGGNNTSVSGYQAAVSVGLGDNWTVAAGMYDDEDSARELGGIYDGFDVTGSNGTISGVTVHGNVGDIYIGGTFQSDDDVDGIQLHVGFGNFFVNYGQADASDADYTPTEIGVGYAQSIGENTTFWAEAVSKDGDDVVADSEEIVAALRYDWN